MVDQSHSAPNSRHQLENRVLMGISCYTHSHACAYLSRGVSRNDNFAIDLLISVNLWSLRCNLVVGHILIGFDKGGMPFAFDVLCSMRDNRCMRRALKCCRPGCLALLYQYSVACEVVSFDCTQLEGLCEEGENERGSRPGVTCHIRLIPLSVIASYSLLADGLMAVRSSLRWLRGFEASKLRYLGFDGVRVTTVLPRVVDCKTARLRDC